MFTGWVKPFEDPTSHYFLRDTRSLCGGWRVMGEVLVGWKEEGRVEAILYPDRCRLCHKRLVESGKLEED